VAVAEAASVSTRDIEGMGDARQYYDAGRFPEAERICHRILQAQPDNAHALYLLGRIAFKLGRYKIAVILLGRAVSLLPEEASFHYGLGEALRLAGQPEPAAASLRQALALLPDFPKAYRGLGASLLEMGDREGAVASFRRALALDPNYVRAHHGLGVALLHQGEQAAAVASFRRALELAPDFADAHAGILFALHYVQDCDRTTLYQETRAWGERYAEPLTRAAQPHSNTPDPERRLRIGYVSADFHNHPVGMFLRAVLASHDRSEVEVFCYTNSLRVDETTQRLKEATDHWRIIWGMMDEAAAGMIRRDAIDILVDLSGHTAGNRLLLFARKPAPVQVSWLGYFDTTGVSAVDYLLADRFVCPEGDESLYVEQIIRLAGSYLCYTPPRHPVDVSPLPARSRGYVTFGCFNNIPKVTDGVVAVWAEILRRVPLARLLMKTAALEDPSVKDRYLALFAAQGIGAERLVFQGHSAHAEYLAAYGEVDIALDPFPYNGGTITVDSLWMGVPVVTLRGDRFVSRMGVTHLSAIGLDELIAGTRQEYVEKAVELAGDLERLDGLRSSLRQRLKHSSLCDGSQFTKGLESTYREMWRRWCLSTPPTP
jgi:protein O-GlcNAc transferase